MRILQLTHNYPSEIDKTEGIFIHRINRLLTYSNDITVIVFKPRCRIPRIIGKYKIDGIDVLVVNYFRPKGRIFNSADGLFMLSAISLIKKQIINFDLIHSHWQTDAGLVGTILAEKYNKPNIVSVRGARIFDQSKNSLYGKLSSIVFRHSKLIHTHGRSIQYELRKKYLVPENKMIWIPNIIFDTNQINTLLEVNICRPTVKDEYTFLFIGLDGEHKGLYDAVHAFIKAKTSNHQLTIITDISTQFYKMKIEPIILGKQNIIALNKVPPEEVCGFYSKSDVFLFPSYAEGSPNVVLEAMAAGCYIISYNIPGVNKLLIHNQNARLVEKKDVLSLTDEINLFISGKMNGYIEKFRKHNHNFIIKNYDPDIIVRDYLNMYKGTLP